MDLPQILAGVREHRYQHRDGQDQPAQQHLRAARQSLADHVPVEMIVKASGAGQSLPVVPWLAVLNPEVTKTAQEGLYVVYLYRKDLSRVYLSMNQGTTQHLNNAKALGLKGARAEAAALQELEKESTLLRAGLSEAALAGLLPEIDLGASRYFLPRGYELGNVAAIEYDMTRLPDETTLSEDLTRMLALYASCVDIKAEILATEPGRIKTTAAAKSVTRPSPPKPPIFRPKSSAAYIAEIKAQIQERKPRHEKLVEVFGQWMQRCGFVPATNVHPRDMTVDADGQHWLIEVKIVPSNAETVVREAIGQLFSYRHFCYREKGKPDPLLAALFSEPIGEAFSQLLSSLGIEAIWRVGGGWEGSSPEGTVSLLERARLASG